MKRTIALLPVLALVLGASALDTTVSNDFWCTWDYPYRTNAVNEKAAVASAALRSVVSTSVGSNPPVPVFDTNPTGAIIIVR